jgi:hypothetical protein
MNKQNLIDELRIKNNNLDNTLVEGFLDDRIISKLPFHVIEYCVNFPNAQKALIELSDTNLDIFSKIINHSIKHRYDWISASTKFIKFITNPLYQEFNNDLEGKTIESSDISKLIFFTRNSNNFYNLKKYKDFLKIEQKREDLIKKYRHTKDSEKLLLVKYGISKQNATKYLDRYGKDVNKLPNSKEKDFLLDLNNIIEHNKTNNMKLESYDFINYIGTKLRNLYIDIYNKELFKINEKTRYLKTVEYKDKKIKVYDAGSKFYMAVHSYGMAYNYEEPKNFFIAWNIPNTKSENFCNSIITESSFHLRVKHCLFGFSEFPKNNIDLMAPNDLGTNSLEGNPSVTNFYTEKTLIAEVSFRIPEELIKNTRYTNNEIYRKRRKTTNGKLKKINPDYIIYLKENSKMNIEKDRIWKESLKAASQFSKDNEPIPIVIIDCEKCLKKDLERINANIKKMSLLKKPDHKLTHDTLEYIYTLKAGFYYLDYLEKKYLSKEKLLPYLYKILEYQTVGDMDNTLKGIKIIKDTIMEEYNKNLESPYWIRETNVNGLLEEPTEVLNIITKFQQEYTKK